MVYLIYKPVKANLKPVTIGLFLSLLLLTEVWGQANTGWKRENYWFISGGTGMAILAGEIKKDFTFLPNEFSHSPGIAFNLDFGRTFSNQWETLLRINAYNLFGKSNLPEFSAVGIHPSLSGQLYPEPVEYITTNSSVSVLLRYMFKRNHSGQGNTSRFHPFAEAGAGIHSFKSDLRYQTAPAQEKSTLIFRKQDGDTPVGVAVITTGLGAKAGTPGRMNVLLTWNAELINYDALDAVHHYSNATRNHARTIIMKLTAGLTIPFGGNPQTDIFLPFRW
jgi:hypothetical protein